jgi:ABC-type glycerol-3-phosphate transport system substrate-binding protein
MKTLLITAALIAAPWTAMACDVPDGPEISATTSTFPAYVAIGAAMEECPNVTVVQDLEVRVKGPEALAANPALIDVVSVHNDTIVPYLKARTIRPLNDLVERYGQDLSPNQLITIDGEIMAIAMIVNLKHFMYREDIFAELDLTPPETFEEMLAAAETIRQAGVVEFPLAMTYMGGWNLAAAFNDMFMAKGDTLVTADFQPNVDGETGRETLEMLARTAEYLDPEFLISDSTYVQQQLQQEKTAMAVLWASRAGAMDDEAESAVVGRIAGSMAPRPGDGDLPASMLYWDGLAIAANISDEAAERAFQVIVHGGNPEMVAANSDKAIWLAPGYQPGRLAQAAIDTIDAGTVSSPSADWKGLMIDAVGRHVSTYLTGAMTADEALEAIEADYVAAAREAGILE